MNRNGHGIIAVVPQKPLRSAKSRLASFMDPARREALVLNMLSQVLKSATAVVERVWVVGGDPKIEVLAQRCGARWRPEEGLDVNQSLEMAFRAVWDLGLAPLYLPADLPFIRRRDVDGIIGASGPLRNAVLAPAYTGGGTNGILLPLPTAFRPLLGPGSFRRHIELAQSLGLAVAIYYSRGLALDLDTPDDMRAYKAMEPDLPNRLTKGESHHG